MTICKTTQIKTQRAHERQRRETRVVTSGMFIFAMPTLMPARLFYIIRYARRAHAISPSRHILPAQPTYAATASAAQMFAHTAATRPVIFCRRRLKPLSFAAVFFADIPRFHFRMSRRYDAAASTTA
jgi:hypothetical protein